jgi:hypothetical protein
MKHMHTSAGGLPMGATENGGARTKADVMQAQAAPTAENAPWLRVVLMRPAFELRTRPLLVDLRRLPSA